MNDLAFTAMWADAVSDVDKEARLEAMASARVALAGTWPFLAAAHSTDEFEHRLALVAEQVEAQTAPGVLGDVVAGLRSDFATLDATRRTEAAAVRTAALTVTAAKGEDGKDVMPRAYVHVHKHSTEGDEGDEYYQIDHVGSPTWIKTLGREEDHDGAMTTARQFALPNGLPLYENGKHVEGSLLPHVASDEAFWHEGAQRWVMRTALFQPDPSDAWRYSAYPPIPYGPSSGGAVTQGGGPLGPDGFPVDLAAGEGRAQERMEWQSTPQGNWVVPPDAAWRDSSMPNAATGMPQTYGQPQTVPLSPGGAANYVGAPGRTSRRHQAGSLKDMTYHERFGPVSREQLRAYKKHNVSTSDHDEMEDHFGQSGPENSPKITQHVVNNSSGGMYQPGWGWQHGSSRRYAVEGVVPTPGPNPAYFAIGDQGLASPPEAGFPQDPGPEPKDNNHIDDLYGDAPAPISGGSAMGRSDPYGYRHEAGHAMPSQGQPYRTEPYLVGSNGTRQAANWNPFNRTPAAGPDHPKGKQVCYNCQGEGKINGQNGDSANCQLCGGSGYRRLGSMQAEAEYKYVKQQGNKWVVTQKDTGKVLSHHDTEEDAKASFRAMMQSKHSGSLDFRQSAEERTASYYDRAKPSHWHHADGEQYYDLGYQHGHGGQQPVYTGHGDYLAGHRDGRSDREVENTMGYPRSQNMASRRTASSLSQQLHSMQSGQQMELSSGHHIRYDAEQALGDDNKPAKGYTVGAFTVTDPNGKSGYYRHSPYSPTGWASGAKRYAADQAEKHVSDWHRKQSSQRTAVGRYDLDHSEGYDHGLAGQGLTDLYAYPSHGYLNGHEQGQHERAEMSPDEREEHDEWINRKAALDSHLPWGANGHRLEEDQPPAGREDSDCSCHHNEWDRITTINPSCPDHGHLAGNDFHDMHDYHASRHTAATDGLIVGHCDNCRTPVRYHRDEGGTDELRHLHSNDNRCSTGKGRAKTSSLHTLAVPQFYEINDLDAVLSSLPPAVAPASDPNQPDQMSQDGSVTGDDMNDPGNPMQQTGGYRQAGVTLTAPTAENPTGRGEDEFRAKTWDALTKQRPMQSLEDRNINTPTMPGEPMQTRNINTPTPGLGDEGSRERTDLDEEDDD